MWTMMAKIRNEREKSVQQSGGTNHTDGKELEKYTRHITMPDSSNPIRQTTKVKNSSFCPAL